MVIDILAIIYNDIIIVCNSVHCWEFSQLNDEIDAKVKLLPQQKTQYTCTSTNFEYTGVSVTCPSGHTYIVRAEVHYNNSQPSGIAASSLNTNLSYFYARYAYVENIACITFTLLAGETAYIWGRWATASKSNDVLISIVDITN